MTEAAPFHADLAEGPQDGSAVWLRAADGVRVRAGHWPGGPRGTIFIFPGRCEYIEKYGRTAQDCRERGYTTVAIDWRGQGLSDRLLKNPDIGHVRRFADYQADLAAVLAWAHTSDLPQPWFLIAHSMGGAIGLRALTAGAPFEAAAFSAPMWGILIAPKLKHIARTVPIFARHIGLGGRQAPTTDRADFFLAAPFEGNFLTTDRGMWDYMKAQAAAQPRFRLGGPSLTWLAEALSETRALHLLPRPKLPAHVTIGGEEKIVDPDAVRRLTETWPSADLAFVPEAEHEILMERPAIRTGFLDRAEAMFERAKALA